MKYNSDLDYVGGLSLFLCQRDKADCDRSLVGGMRSLCLMSGFAVLTLLRYKTDQGNKRKKMPSSIPPILLTLTISYTHVDKNARTYTLRLALILWDTIWTVILQIKYNKDLQRDWIDIIHSTLMFQHLPQDIYNRYLSLSKSIENKKVQCY